MRSVVASVYPLVVPARDSGLGVDSRGNSLGDGQRGRPRSLVRDPETGELVPKREQDRTGARTSELPTRRPLEEGEQQARWYALLTLGTYLRMHTGAGVALLPAVPSLAGRILAPHGRCV